MRALFVDFADELQGGLMLLGEDIELIFAGVGHQADLRHDGAHVAHGLHHVAGAGFALGANHGRALGASAQGLAQVSGAADEGDGEGVLVHVVGVVGGGQHFTLVDEVHLQRLKDFGLGKVADAAFGHDGDADGLLDAEDHVRIAHAGDSAIAADVGGHALQGHDGDGASVFGDAGLLGVDDVHDDAVLQHFGKADLLAPGLARRVVAHVVFYCEARPDVSRGPD
jgi:hypothetical protein